MGEILENQTIVRRHRKIFFLLRRLRRATRNFGSLFVLLVTMAGISFGVTRSTIFSIQHIEIIGDFRNVRSEEVSARALVKPGVNLFRLSLKEVEKKIAAMPWVESVFVRRQIPHTLWIHVKEYKPKAILLSDRLYFVSDKGKVFKKVEQEGTRDLPVLTGFGKEDSFENILSLIDFFDSKLDFSLFGLSEIHYNEATGFSIVTLMGPMEIKLGKENLSAKLHRFKTVWAYLKPKVSAIRGIDLDYEDRAFVKL